MSGKTHSAPYLHPAAMAKLSRVLMGIRLVKPAEWTEEHVKSLKCGTLQIPISVVDQFLYIGQTTKELVSSIFDEMSNLRLGSSLKRVTISLDEDNYSAKFRSTIGLHTTLRIHETPRSETVIAEIRFNIYSGWADIDIFFIHAVSGAMYPEAAQHLSESCGTRVEIERIAEKLITALREAKTTQTNTQESAGVQYQARTKRSLMKDMLARIVHAETLDSSNHPVETLLFWNSTIKFLIETFELNDTYPDYIQKPFCYDPDNPYEDTVFAAMKGDSRVAICHRTGNCVEEWPEDKIKTFFEINRS